MLCFVFEINAFTVGVKKILKKNLVLIILNLTLSIEIVEFKIIIATNTKNCEDNQKHLFFDHA